MKSGRIDDLQRRAATWLDEEHPDRIRMKRLRRWVPYYFELLGPCKCLPPHPRLSWNCTDFRLLNRVGQALEPHGVADLLISFIWPGASGGRPRGTRGIAHRKPRPLQPASQTDAEIYEYLKTRRTYLEARHGKWDLAGMRCDQRERRARTETRSHFSVTAKELQRIISLIERREPPPRHPKNPK